MPTIKNLFEDAVRYEESALAHYIFFLLQEGKVNPNDDQSTLDFNLCYADKYQNMKKENYLGLCQVKVYSLKQNKQHFVFIFAEGPQDAKALYYQKFKQAPLNCMELSLDEVMAHGNRFMTFREIKKEMKNFPCIYGFYEKPYADIGG